MTSGHNHNSQYAIDTERLINDLIVEIEARAASMTSDDLGNSRYYLLESAKYFRRFNPNSLYTHLKNGLEFEAKILAEIDSEFDGTFKEIDDLLAIVNSNEVETFHLTQSYEKFSNDYHAATRNNAYFEQMISETPDYAEFYETQRTAQNSQIQISLNQLTGSRLSLVNNIKSVIRMAEDLQLYKVYNYLNQWHFKQMREANDAAPASLDIIQCWFENLAKILLKTREQVKTVTKLKQQLLVDEGNLQDFLPGLLAKSSELLESLVQRSFVIEKQPQQVLKTKTK
jgi:STAT protein, all-alpha domain